MGWIFYIFSPHIRGYISIFSDMVKFQSGAVVDIRPAKEKLKDYKFEEIVASANPVNWTEKPQSEWRKFPIFSQNGSGSCVAFTLAKLLGILYFLKNNVFVNFSATHLYQRRKNKPYSGMAGVDAFNIAIEGVTLEELVPSQNMNDTQMDSVDIPQYKKDVGSIFKIGNYLSLPIKDIDTIASVIQTTNKAVMVWFYFAMNEWGNEPVVINPNLDLNALATNRHSVVATDFTLYKGKKALIIDDSWGALSAMNGQRIITEDFFNARNWFSAYPINFKFADKSPDIKLEYKFSEILIFGQKNDDIKMLQNILKNEGLFPSNVVSTGYYGAITAKAVLQWQIKHNVADLLELNSLAGYRIGDKTIKKLNEIYG